MAVTFVKEYAYFPGCSLESFAREYDRSAKLVANNLGIKLRELEDWNCCGATAVASVDVLLSYSLPARNLALAESTNLDLAVACNACLATLQRTKDLFKSGGSSWAAKVEESLAAIGKKFKGKLAIKHLLDILVEDVGVRQIKRKLKRVLPGLKVVPYYGCQIARPRHRGLNAELPLYLDELLAVTGVNVLPYEHKTKCCGGVLMTVKEAMAMQMCEELLREAHTVGAQAIVVTCPMCQQNLDLYQSEINKCFGTNYELPIIYFTQLLGLALGFGVKEMGIDKAVVSARKLLRQYA